MPKEMLDQYTSEGKVFTPGQHVEGNWCYVLLKKWYPATVHLVRADGTVWLKYHDGDEHEQCPPEHVQHPQRTSKNDLTNLTKYKKQYEGAAT